MSLILGAHGGVIRPHNQNEIIERGFQTLETGIIDAVQAVARVGGPNENKSAARQIFDSFKKKAGRVTQDGLVEWILTNKVFPRLNHSDAKLTAVRLFKDIDTNHNGTIDYSEFSAFLQLVQREQKTINYVHKHHLTCLPASVRVTNTREFSVEQIEKTLFEKIDQLTSRDTDRHRQILSLFKYQVQRSTGKADEDILCMTSRDFSTFLNMLGLFATREQAELLFNKYDANGNGSLTVHEFLTRAKAPDYPGVALDKAGANARRRGKKQFNNTARYGVPVQVRTPGDHVYEMGSDSFRTRIRERLEQRARTGRAFSDQNARRTLFSHFERKDPHRTGRLSTKDFKDAMETGVGVIITGAHMRDLARQYAAPDTPGQIDYTRVVMEVYPPPPSGEAFPNASLFRNTDLGQSGTPSGRKNTQNTSNPRNQVHLTGSYWSSPAPLPPLSRGASSSLEIRGRTPGPRSGGF